MERKIIITAALFGMIAIIFGAFGAHALKEILSPEQLTSFETGVRYQMYHAFFLFFVASRKELSLKTLKVIYNLVLGGVLLFSGSIYLLTTKNVTSVDFKIIGFVTPIGGFLLIFAWFVLLATFFKKKS
ncbi:MULTISPECIES: DUF423 domain-containing protein [Flavobacterium]|uniref:DUF423 domain-containing protein n=1 Tax=Flavobacterium salmonis TaxID=2654844 RepID=A0A6V6YQC6_9FLAO|nr:MULTISPECIES: DUF423 domain-containing protein [Flavobacterium]OOV19764.1 hypothetical protein BXU10_09045 [Flavobacterium sp. LM4]CAD0001559.1 hypothetical protein FLAT13_00651 [Flavobacterium salmonis]